MKHDSRGSSPARKLVLRFTGSHLGGSASVGVYLVMMVAVLGMGLATSAAPPPDTPKSVDDVIQRVREMKDRGAPRSEIAKYVLNVVDNRIISLNRQTDDERGQLDDAAYEKAEEFLKAWSNRGEGVDEYYSAAHWAWQHKIGHCNENAHTVMHILMMGTGRDDLAEFTCGDHVYVVWGIPSDTPNQLEIKDVKSLPDAWVIDAWQGVTKPTADIGRMDFYLTAAGLRTIERQATPTIRQYTTRYERWLEQGGKMPDRTAPPGADGVKTFQPGKATCIQEEDADYAQCHNFPYHLLTGRDVHEPVTRAELERLLSELRTHRVYEVVARTAFAQLEADKLEYGDILVVGTSHSAVVWKHDGRTVIKHFLGKTVWENGKIVRASDGFNTKNVLDHGLFLHTLGNFAKLGPPALPYGQMTTTVWRLRWVGDWRATKADLHIPGWGGDSAPADYLKKLPPSRFRVSRLTPGTVELSVSSFVDFQIERGRLQLDLAGNPLRASGTFVTTFQTGGSTYRFNFRIKYKLADDLQASCEELTEGSVMANVRFTQARSP